MLQFSLRALIAYQHSRGRVENSLKFQLNQGRVDTLDMDPYVACFAYEWDYPEQAKEIFSFNDTFEDMSISGRSLLQYGAGQQCPEAESEIKVNVKHSTSAEAYKRLKNKWYYKECMALKNSPSWVGRKGLLLTNNCFHLLWKV